MGPSDVHAATAAAATKASTSRTRVHPLIGSYRSGQSPPLGSSPAGGIASMSLTVAPSLDSTF